MGKRPRSPSCPELTSHFFKGDLIIPQIELPIVLDPIPTISEAVEMTPVFEDQRRKRVYDSPVSSIDDLALPAYPPKYASPHLPNRSGLQSSMSKDSFPLKYQPLKRATTPRVHKRSQSDNLHKNRPNQLKNRVSHSPARSPVPSRPLPDLPKARGRHRHSEFISGRNAGRDSGRQSRRHRSGLRVKAKGFKDKMKRLVSPERSGHRSDSSKGSQSPSPGPFGVSSPSISDNDASNSHSAATQQISESVSATELKKSRREERKRNRHWSIEDLVVEITSSRESDCSHTRKAVLLCYRQFSSSIELMTALRNRFKFAELIRLSCSRSSQSTKSGKQSIERKMTATPPISNGVSTTEQKNSDTPLQRKPTYEDDTAERWSIRVRVANVVRYWLKVYWTEDFAHDLELQRELELFENDIRVTVADPKKVEALVQKIRITLNSARQSNSNFPLKSRKRKYRNRTTSANLNLISEESSAGTDDNMNLANIPGVSRIKMGRVQEFELVRSHTEKRLPSLGSDIESDDSESKQHEKVSTLPMNLPSLTRRPSKEESTHSDQIKDRWPYLGQLTVIIPQNLRLVSLDPDDIAQQLSLMEFHIFSKIKPREFIGQSWKKEDKWQAAPNICKMIAQFNSVTRWVQMTILNGHTTKQRAQYIKKMITMMYSFQRLRNFSSLCAFFTALESGVIKPLKGTWEKTPKSTRKAMDEFRQLFTWKMSKFRVLHEEAPSPAIPHLGLYLHVLFNIEEGKENMSRNGGVNYVKMMMLSSQIEQLIQCTQGRYDATFDPMIQSLLCRDFELQSVIKEDHLEHLSDETRKLEKAAK